MCLQYTQFPSGRKLGVDLRLDGRLISRFLSQRFYCETQKPVNVNAINGTPTRPVFFQRVEPLHRRGRVGGPPLPEGGSSALRAHRGAEATWRLDDRAQLPRLGRVLILGLLTALPLTVVAVQLHNGRVQDFLENFTTPLKTNKIVRLFSERCP